MPTFSIVEVDIVNPNPTGVYQDVTVAGTAIKTVSATNQLRVGTKILPGYTMGQYETSLGLNNLSLATGSSNTAIGCQTLMSSTTGFQNTGVGAFALQDNTTGSSNTAVGLNALQKNTTGQQNCVLGQSAGYHNTTGDLNVLFGSFAGTALTTANNNIFIGSGAGLYTTTGSNNVIVGDGVYTALPTTSNSITLGNATSNVLRCNVTSITALSDARDKEDVVELAAGLEFVNELNPVSFVWNDRDENGKHGVKDFGFIAQDLKATQEKHDMAETLGLVYEENPEKLEASYGKLIPILVKAIKELSSKVEALESKKK